MEGLEASPHGLAREALTAQGTFPKGFLSKEVMSLRIQVHDPVKLV